MHSIFKVVGSGVLLLGAISLLSLREGDSRTAQIRQQLVRQADSMLIAVHTLQATPHDAAHSGIMKQRFKKVRLAYKRLEWATEYFDPLTARQVNGPPVPEAELTGQVVYPDGLQVIEACLYPQFDVTQKKTLTGLLSRLEQNASEFKAFFAKTDLQDWQVLDAAKLEVFRVETLGLNDFDDPLQGNCFAESAAALQSTQSVIRLYDAGMSFSAAIRYLQRPVNFNLFDRAAFIRHYADPITRSVAGLHKRLGLPDVRYNRLLKQNAATLFDAGVFNSNAFIAAPEDSATADKIALGKQLFFDPILSGNGKRSCASCHQPDKAFTDGEIKNLDITGKKFIARNTPTLINAALQPAQFYDLRAASLEDQANDVVQNADEMHGDMKLAIGKLWNSNNYRQQFSKAYPQQGRAAIDTFEVMNALASYVRSLTALNSRFDVYMQGNNQSLNGDEVRGFNLFMGKAKCSTCHYLPLFSGALPPRYMQMEAEVIGVPATKNGKKIDADPGTHGIQPLDFNRHAFKITTVRNAALTAPYMHNGVFKTLEEVVDFYNRGGGAGSGIKVPNQTLATDSLHLTPKEKTQLIAFMKSLNSK